MHASLCIPAIGPDSDLTLNTLDPVESQTLEDTMFIIMILNTLVCRKLYPWRIVNGTVQARTN